MQPEIIGMLGELAIYYDDVSPILPFVVAPIFRQQDSLIIAPQSVAKAHDEFVNQIYSGIANVKLPSIYIRALDFKSHVLIVVVFPSNIKEYETNRSGLALTLGALFEKRLFRDLQTPASAYFDLYISQFNRILGVDLYQKGADDILEALKDPSSYAQLKERFEILLDYLLGGTFVISRKSSWKMPRMFKIRTQRSSVPRMILFSHRISPREFVGLFLSDIDRYLDGSGSLKVGVATEHYFNERAISLVRVNGLPNDISRIELTKCGSRSYIHIY